eukprot:152877-Prymnesium_polylepis.1
MQPVAFRVRRHSDGQRVTRGHMFKVGQFREGQFESLRHAEVVTILARWSRPRSASFAHRASAPMEAEANDVAKDNEEENFERGMRQNAAEFQETDKDRDGKLDFKEFCALVGSAAYPCRQQRRPKCRSTGGPALSISPHAPAHGAPDTVCRRSSARA